MLIAPDWPVANGVRALSTTRCGLPDLAGASSGVFASFNLGDHVGDDPDALATNRGALQAACDGLDDIAWLRQVHGIEVADLTRSTLQPGQEADAAITATPGIACVVMTADCLPVLFCDTAGRQVAAAHAGWRGLCRGVLRATVEAFAVPPGEIMAWLGPAISAKHFEVGEEVRQTCLREFAGPAQAEILEAFEPSSRPGHYMMDLYQLARLQLSSLGLAWIGGGGLCTFGDPEQFYSFRRDGQCGRQASLIYIPKPE